METERVWMLFGDISWRIRTVPRQSSPTENTLKQLLPGASSAACTKLSCGCTVQSLGDLLGNEASEYYYGEKKAIRKKNHSEWELEDLQGKIWMGFIHLNEQSQNNKKNPYIKLAQKSTIHLSFDSISVRFY